MKKTLATAPGFISNAFALESLIAFEPEDIRLDVYTFLPWVRTGLGSIVQAPQDDSTRSSVTIGVTVEDDKGGSQIVEKALTVRGPGDVLSIDPSQIIRRYPTPGSTDAEETFLAHIEFDRPELPWLFTPFAPSGPDEGRLDPWLTLVVLERAHSRFEPAPAGMPRRVRTRMAELQPLTDPWAFAHAQVTNDAGDHPHVGVRADGTTIVGSDDSSPSIGTRLSDTYAPVNLSRILCPRRLQDRTAYIACLVPTYDCGVKTGLGLPGGTLEKAWTRTAGDDDEEIVLPYYDAWEFSTAPDGDFEELSRRLVPIRAPWSVGRRVIDTSKPRGGLDDLGADEPGRTQVLKCALFSPQPAPPGSPSESESWTRARRQALVDEIDRPDRVASDATFDNEDLPRIGPRLYGRFQRGQSRVSRVGDTDWFEELNTSPLPRVVAGLGTRVVQKDQESLMQAAWAQVGEVEKANRALRRMQYARFISEAFSRKHLEPLELGALTQVTRRVHGKVKVPGSAFTMAGSITRSHVPSSATDMSFRRAVRPRGPLARRLDNAEPFGTVATPDGTWRDFRRVHTEPDGVRGLRERTLSRLPADVVGQVLGLQAREAIDVLRRRLAASNSLRSAADLLLGPTSRWTRRPTPELDIGALAGRRLLDVLREALPDRPEADPARAEAIATLAGGIAGSGRADLAGDAKAITRRVDEALPEPGAAPARPGIGRATGGGTVFRPTRGRIIDRGLSRSVDRNILRRLGTTRPEARATTTVRFKSATGIALGLALKDSGRLGGATLVSQLSTVVKDIGLLSMPTPPDRHAPAISKGTILSSIAPALTMTDYAVGRLGILPSWLPPTWFHDTFVQPIMAAPSFDRPMYEALDAYDREWLVPGLGKIDRTDFVTLLETNPAFTESFLVGLSDEMGRELLWREYPTDQRGTYFKRFWQDDEDELLNGIHRFFRTPLGSHVAGGGEGNVVLVVRGTLVRRYPDAIMMALRENTTPRTTPPTFLEPESEATTANVLFHAHLPPDIMLVGFDLTVQRVIDERWWFFIAEHPTSPRFGLDTEGANANANPLLRNDMDWADIGRSHGGRFVRIGPPSLTIEERTDDPPPKRTPWPPANAAALARVFLQNPIRAAYDGPKLLTPARGRF